MFKNVEYVDYVRLHYVTAVSVATGKCARLLGENETNLQQILSSNNTKRSVLCAFVGIEACFIVNCEMNKKHGLFKILLATTRSLHEKSRMLSLTLFLPRYHLLSLLLQGLELMS